MSDQREPNPESENRSDEIGTSFTTIPVVVTQPDAQFQDIQIKAASPEITYDSIINPTDEMLEIAQRTYLERLTKSNRGIVADKKMNITDMSVLIDLQLEEAGFTRPSTQSNKLFNMLGEAMRAGTVKALEILEKLSYTQVDSIVACARVTGNSYKLGEDYVSQQLAKRYTRFQIFVENAPRWKILDSINEASLPSQNNLVSVALDELRYLRPNRFEKIENELGFRFSNIPFLKRFSDWMYRQD